MATFGHFCHYFYGSLYLISVRGGPAACRLFIPSFCGTLVPARRMTSYKLTADAGLYEGTYCAPRQSFICLYNSHEANGYLFRVQVLTLGIT